MGLNIYKVWYDYETNEGHMDNNCIYVITRNWDAAAYYAELEAVANKSVFITNIEIINTEGKLYQENLKGVE